MVFPLVILPWKKPFKGKCHVCRVAVYKRGEGVYKSDLLATLNTLWRRWRVGIHGNVFSVEQDLKDMEDIGWIRVIRQNGKEVIIITEKGKNYIKRFGKPPLLKRVPIL